MGIKSIKNAAARLNDKYSQKMTASYVQDVVGDVYGAALLKQLEQAVIDVPTSLQDKVEIVYSLQVLEKLDEILGNDSDNPDELVNQLEQFLSDNWDLIKGTSLCYTALNSADITLFLCDIAEWVADEKNKREPSYDKCFARLVSTIPTRQDELNVLSGLETLIIQSGSTYELAFYSHEGKYTKKTISNKKAQLLLKRSVHDPKVKKILKELGCPISSDSATTAINVLMPTVTVASQRDVIMPLAGCRARILYDPPSQEDIDNVMASNQVLIIFDAIHNTVSFR